MSEERRSSLRAAGRAGWASARPLGLSGQSVLAVSVRAGWAGAEPAGSVRPRRGRRHSEVPCLVSPV